MECESWTAKLLTLTVAKEQLQRDLDAKILHYEAVLDTCTQDKQELQVTIDTTYWHTLSTYSIDKSSQHTLLAHVIDILYQHNTIDTSYRHILSTHPIDTEHTLTTHRLIQYINTPSISTHPHNIFFPF